VRVSAGASRADLYGSQAIALAPEIAEILGVGTGIEAFTRTLYVPQVEATATRAFERSSFYVAYAHQLSGGNGLLQTSAGHTAHAGYSYTGLRKVSLGVSTGYTRQKALGFDAVVPIETYRGGGEFSYTIIPHLNATGHLDWRRWNGAGAIGRSGYSAAIGISYSTSRLPISIW
jgi:hypothetical protein